MPPLPLEPPAAASGGRGGEGLTVKGMSRQGLGKPMLVERPAQSPISVVIWPILRMA